MDNGERRPLQLVLPRNTMIFDYTGLPALMLPSGVGGSGLPVAIRVRRQAGQDDALCLSVGSAFQRATEFHRAAPREADVAVTDEKLRWRAGNYHRRSALAYSYPPREPVRNNSDTRKSSPGCVRWAYLGIARELAFVRNAIHAHDQRHMINNQGTVIVDLRYLQDPNYIHRGVGRHALSILRNAPRGQRIVGLIDPYATGAVARGARRR